MMPMSPKNHASLLSTHHRTIVAIVTALTAHCVLVNGSLLTLTGLMTTFEPPARYDQRRISQMQTTEVNETGIETLNQPIQEMGGFMYSSAMRFCGDEMGEAIPPMLEARAMPRMSAFENGDLDGRVRRMGCGGPVSHATQVGETKDAHLDERVAQNRRRDVRDPHAGEAGDEHVGEQDGARLRAGERENLRCQDLYETNNKRHQCMLAGGRR